VAAWQRFERLRNKLPLVDHRLITHADADGPEPIDDQLQQHRRYLELNQRRDGMWQLHGRLSNTVGAQLNAILDPLTTPRSTAFEDEDGNLIQIPDERPAVQRLHDALEEACARLLKADDQPTVGGVPASVIVTISLQELLAKSRAGRNRRRHPTHRPAVIADSR
jgi:hypothetical protein